MGLPVIVLRPGAIYGPWSRYAFNRLFVEDPLRGLAFRVHGGRHITFPVFVRDVAWAAEAALTRGRPGQVYNICGPCMTHREVGEVLEHLIGRRIRWIPAPPGGWSRWHGGGQPSPAGPVGSPTTPSASTRTCFTTGG